MDNDKIDQHSDEIEVESEEKERGKKIEIDEDRLPSRAMAIHEHIRQDGEKELERDAMALLWSAIAAGHYDDNKTKGITEILQQETARHAFQFDMKYPFCQ